VPPSGESIRSGADRDDGRTPAEPTTDDIRQHVDDTEIPVQADESKNDSR
jgi:hypothetical protein